MHLFPNVQSPPNADKKWKVWAKSNLTGKPDPENKLLQEIETHPSHWRNDGDGTGGLMDESLLPCGLWGWQLGKLGGRGFLGDLGGPEFGSCSQGHKSDHSAPLWFHWLCPSTTTPHSKIPPKALSRTLHRIRHVSFRVCDELETDSVKLAVYLSMFILTPACGTWWGTDIIVTAHTGSW